MVNVQNNKWEKELKRCLWGFKAGKVISLRWKVCCILPAFPVSSSRSTEIHVPVGHLLPRDSDKHSKLRVGHNNNLFQYFPFHLLACLLEIYYLQYTFTQNFPGLFNSPEEWNNLNGHLFPTRQTKQPEPPALNVLVTMEHCYCCTNEETKVKHCDKPARETQVTRSQVSYPTC